MDNQNALCEIHHTPLINGQCVVCNRDEDREDIVREASRGWREPTDSGEKKEERRNVGDGIGEKEGREGVDHFVIEKRGIDDVSDLVPPGTFRERFTSAVHEVYGKGSREADMLSRKPTPMRPRAEEPRHRAAHVKRKRPR